MASGEDAADGQGELTAHLAALPAPQLERVARAVLGSAPRGARGEVVRELTALLGDPAWVERTLCRLGPRARAALAAVASAGVPILRRDLTALAAADGDDPVDALEEHGLLVPVRTGRGMPTHVAVTRGIGLAESFAEPQPPEPEPAAGGPEMAGRRRRFELALMLAVVAQHPPRLTHAGRLHARDAARLAALLSPLGLGTRAIERRLDAWTDLGIASEGGGHLRVVPAVFDDVPRAFLALALAQLAAPSAPGGALRIVGRLLESGRACGIGEALEAAQSELLRARAGGEESLAERGARSELVDVGKALLDLDCLALQDGKGQAIALHEGDFPASGVELPLLALDPAIAALLRGEQTPAAAFAHGHVQSSYEVVADSACDPTLVARVALWSRLVRADRAAVLMLERDTVMRAGSLGFDVRRLLADLAVLGHHAVPGNVATVLQDWYGAAVRPDRPHPGVSGMSGELPDPEALARAARAALRG